GDRDQLSKFTADGKFVWRAPDPGSDPDLSPLHGVAVRNDGAVILGCETCGRLLVIDPKDGRIRERLDAQTTGGPTNIDPHGNIYVAQYVSQAQMVLDPSGTRLIGAWSSTVISNLGNGHVEWGDTFWPSPVFLAD